LASTPASDIPKCVTLPGGDEMSLHRAGDILHRHVGVEAVLVEKRIPDDRVCAVKARPRHRCSPSA
jgi:hypothetical protein